MIPLLPNLFRITNYSPVQLETWKQTIAVFKQEVLDLGS